MTLSLVAGQRVDRYSVEGKLGEGGMAVVFRVRHETLGTPHALKVVSLTSRDVRERLIREGKVQAHLRHDNIVQVTDVIVVNDEPGLVMEFVEGPTLEAWLLRYRPTVDEAVAVFRGIASGIGYAHTRGLIHRDLKPANVLLAFTHDRLIPKVTDFGLAKDRLREHTSRTRIGSTMGTPGYMAPEQIRDASSVDWRADVWSLGCILYRLTCGIGPFEGDDLIEVFRQVSEADYVSSRALRPDLPEQIHQAIEGLLEVDPDKRITDAGVLIQFLDGKLARVPTGTGPQVAPTAPATDLPRWLPIDSEAAEVARYIVEETLSHLPKIDRDPLPTAWDQHALANLPPPSKPASRVSHTLIPTQRAGGLVVLTGGLAMAGGVVALLLVAMALVVGLVAWQRTGVGEVTLPPLQPPMVVEKLEIVPDPVAQAPLDLLLEELPVEELDPEPVVGRKSAKPVLGGPTDILVRGEAPEPVPVVRVVPVTIPSVTIPSATVNATGADSVSLVSVDNVEVTDLSAVPPGRYRVYAAFHGGEPVRAGELNVSDGQHVKLRCESIFMQCRPE